MFKTIAIVILTLALGGAGYFGWTQKSAYGGATKEVAELTKQLEEAEAKTEEAAEALTAAEEALPPLEAKVKEFDAVKGVFANGAVLKDLEALYAKDKKLTTEKQLGLAGIRMLTNGGKDPSTIEAFQKAIEMTDWKSQQQVICSAQKALAASGEKVKVMSECKEDAPAVKGDKGAKDAKSDKADAKDKKDEATALRKMRTAKMQKQAKNTLPIGTMKARWGLRTGAKNFQPAAKANLNRL
jgi:hypothetical protein